MDFLPFGINYINDPMKDYVGGPEEILDPSMIPGDCWGLYSLPGNVTIKLVCPIHVTHVTIEHANFMILDNKGETAPRDFEIYGTEITPEGIFKQTLLLSETYKLDKGILQIFPIPKNTEKNIQKWDYVTLVILTNHGNGGWTCMYRLRVHSDGTCTT